MAASVTARQRREEEIVDATKALFDERGMQDAPMDQIARTVGINRALLYRHFASKEELYVLTVTRYLDDLEQRLREAVATAAQDDPRARFERLCEAYADFCLEFPAFLDCALSLMRRPWADLSAAISPGVSVRLARSMAGCLSITSRLLADGKARGVFAIDDPDLTANHLYAQGLGAMHLARVGVGVRERAPGLPEPFEIAPDTVRAAMVAAAVALISPDSPRAR